MNIDLTKSSDMPPLGNWEEEKDLNVCMRAWARVSVCACGRECVCLCEGEW